jgi:two-component system, OmpR family, manganese sensing sensor histidine kinase
LAVSATAVHFIVAEVVREESSKRLEDVARAGLRSIAFKNGTFEVDQNEVLQSGLLTEAQGLQWYDSRGNVVSTQGLTPNAIMAKEFETYAMPIVSPISHQRVGTVIASIWTASAREERTFLDYGLLAGALLAFAGSGLAGFAFSRWASKLVDESVRKLREFTADASHELRGPIAAIAANADAALRDTARDPGRDLRRFEAIADGASQVARLTSDLLILAAVDRPLGHDLYAIDVSDTLERLAEAHRWEFEKAGVSFAVKAAEVPTYYGNPDQIERIVSNLLQNAARYTPAGGSVSMECEHTGTEVRITVQDTGIGIRQEDLDRIFDRFWRADTSRGAGGTGLGLSIARALARRHGGDVKVTSTQGDGSTFVVVLPLRLPVA